MDPFFVWIEESALTTFLRETNSVFVFPAMLVLHAVGMALLVGTHLVVAVRILGLAPLVPLSALKFFVPVGWVGLGVNVFSGVLLLAAYPTKALTNPLFYIKMSLVVIALIVFTKINKSVFCGASEGTGGDTDGGGATLALRDKRMAMLLLILWAATIFAGRFLAYTYTRLTAFN
jgi:hypothetical protein